MPTTSPSSASEPVAVGDERGERSARRTAAIAALARQPGTLLAGVVAFVFSWPVSSLTPVAGLDGAWPVALHMAAHQGLDFGPDIVFTYGPLGFLKEPLAIYPWTARLAFAYTAAIHLALAVTLVAMLRPTFGLVAGAALSLLLGALAVQEPALLLAFLWAVALTTVRLRPARARAFAAALGYSPASSCSQSSTRASRCCRWPSSRSQGYAPTAAPPRWPSLRCWRSR